MQNIIHKIAIKMTRFPSLILTLTILSLTSTHTFSISIQFPTPSFPTTAADSHSLSGAGDTVQLNHPTPSTSAIIFPNTPFNFTSSTSLFSHFTFKIGNTVSLVIIPAKFHSNFYKNMSFEVLEANRLLGIEFYANVCTISVSRVRVSNVSKSYNVSKDEVKLSAWIDYTAALKRLDVRLSKVGDSNPKPVEPLISFRIDLGEILKGKEVLLGLVSLTGNSERVTSVYSWSFEIKDAPKWLHSIPVNPYEHSTVEIRKKKDGFLSGLVFATGCGALAALVMFFVWSYAVDREKVHEEVSGRPGDFKYEKIDVLEVKNSEG